MLLLFSILRWAHIKRAMILVLSHLPANIYAAISRVDYQEASLQGARVPVVQSSSAVFFIAWTYLALSENNWQGHRHDYRVGIVLKTR
jgi:hypothetical protein